MRFRKVTATAFNEVSKIKKKKLWSVLKKSNTKIHIFIT